jgi:glycerophosphoryl diester phosphodiesterase
LTKEVESLNSVKVNPAGSTPSRRHRSTARDVRQRRVAEANPASLLDFDGRAVELKVHRCLWSGDYPENSLPAIDECYRERVSHAELDLYMLEDEDYVVFHDDTLDSKTTGQGPTEQLHKQAASRIFLLEDGRPTTYRLPIFSEIGDMIAECSFPTLLELDLQTYWPLPWRRVEELATVIDRIRDRVIFNGTDWNVRRLLRVDNTMPVGTGVEFYLDWAPEGTVEEDLFPNNMRRGAYGYFDSHPLASERRDTTRDYLIDRLIGIWNLVPSTSELHLRVDLMEQIIRDGFVEIIDFIHERDCVVDVWTLNSDAPRWQERLTALVELGVDSVATDTQKDLEEAWRSKRRHDTSAERQ